MLDAKDFRRVAAGGFGDPHNSNAWSMAWFKGKLYVGTLRDTLWLFRMAGYFTFLDPLPIKLPPITEMDLRAQIWRYTPESDSFEQVYTSPMMPITLREVLQFVRSRRRRRGMRMGTRLRSLLGLFKARFRLQLGREFGYRNMAVFTDEHGEQALYVATMGPAGHILRSVDGTNFEVVSQPGLGLPNVLGFRNLVSFKGRLYTTPVGRPDNPNFAVSPIVYESRDPSMGAVDPGVWVGVSESGFGDPDNLGIFEMGVFQDHLYAGTANPNGFEIWKTDASGSPPYEWKRVVKGGGYKQSPSNLGVISMCPFGEWLYVGSAGTPPSLLKQLEATPAELIRISADDSWQVVVGAPRETEHGFMEPISGMPAGFGNPLAVYFWYMEEHDGWLYAGMNDRTPLLRYTPRDQMTAELGSILDQRGGSTKVIEEESGADLWRTQDGSSWFPITRTGFGNPFNQGIRTLQSSPAGLFVGCADYYTQATHPTTGEPCGGLEIWLGAS